MPREIWVLFTATLVNKAGSMVLAFLVLYLTRSLGFSVGTAATVLLLYGAGALLAAPFAGYLSDRLEPIRVMRASLLVSGMILLAFPFARSLTFVVLLTIALSVAAESFRPANLTIFEDDPLLSPARVKTIIIRGEIAD